MGNQCCTDEKLDFTVIRASEDFLKESSFQPKYQQVIKHTNSEEQNQKQQSKTQLQPVTRKMEMPDGCVYQGQVFGGVPHGKGKEINANGQTYQGSFYEGVKHGTGTYTYNDQTMYKGSFLHGKIDGNGEIRWKNGDKYRGEFSNNIINGKGQYFYAKDNLTYQGTFLNGIKHGKGIIRTGSKEFIGEWKNGHLCADHFKELE